MTTGTNSLTNAETGSPLDGEPVYLAIGRLRRPHGVRGEILLDVLTDFPERIQAGDQVYVGDAYTPMKLISRRGHAKGLLVSFENYQDRDEVARLRNTYVYVLAADRPSLPEGEYYHHQLVGLQVVEDETGKVFGELIDIVETGANDVYVVRPESGRDILLPAIPQVVLDVDLERGQMTVHILPGLLDEEH